MGNHTKSSSAEEVRDHDGIDLHLRRCRVGHIDLPWEPDGSDSREPVLESAPSRRAAK